MRRKRKKSDLRRRRRRVRREDRGKGKRERMMKRRSGMEDTQLHRHFDGRAYFRVKQIASFCILFLVSSFSALRIGARRRILPNHCIH